MLQLAIEGKIDSIDRFDSNINHLYSYVSQNPITKFDSRGLIGDGTPGNNQAQNKQVNDICRELKLNRDQRGILHREISRQNYNYHEIRIIAIEIFGFPGSR